MEDLSILLFLIHAANACSNLIIHILGMSCSLCYDDVKWGCAVLLTIWQGKHEVHPRALLYSFTVFVEASPMTPFYLYRATNMRTAIVRGPLGSVWICEPRIVCSCHYLIIAFTHVPTPDCMFPSIYIGK
jgi:hypothetical protein